MKLQARECSDRRSVGERRDKIASGDNDLDVDLTRCGAKSRKGAIAYSERLAPRGADTERALHWRQLEPGASWSSASAP